MVLSFIASIHALYMKYQQTVISEDGATFLDEILKVLGESLLIEAFRYAKISGQDEMDYLEVRNVLRIMIIDGEIFRFAYLTSEKYHMKVMNWDKPEQIPNYCGLILPFIDIYNDMNSRDSAMPVNIEAALYYSAILEYFAVEVAEVSCMMAKEVGSNEITAQLIRQAIEADAELREILFPAVIAPDIREAEEASALLNEIIDLLHIDRSTLKPASEEEITVIEEKFELALPGYLRSLLKISNGSYSMGLYVFLFPSLSDIDDQFLFSSDLAKTYRLNRWIPYKQVDYDSCWEILEVRSGGTILQFDVENDKFWQNGKNEKDLITLMKRLRLFRNYLLSRENLQSTEVSELKSDEGFDYEKSQGYESMEMNGRFRSMYYFSLDSIESGRPLRKKARK